MLPLFERSDAIFFRSKYEIWIVILWTGLNPIVQIGQFHVDRYFVVPWIFGCFPVLIKNFLQLTWLARAVQGNIGPQSFLCRRFCYDLGPIFTVRPSRAVSLTVSLQMELHILLLKFFQLDVKSTRKIPQGFWVSERLCQHCFFPKKYYYYSNGPRVEVKGFFMVRKFIHLD